MAAPDNAASNGPRPRQYLSLNRLKFNELPPHPDFPTSRGESQPTLVQFLDAVFAEVCKVDFDNGWTDHGKWDAPDPTVLMPTLTNEASTTGSSPNQTARDVPISVDQRMKIMADKKTWVARRSYHMVNDVTYAELADLVSHEHALNEGRLLPYLYDANELLNWSPQDLDKAVAQLTGEFKIQSVEMNIFQMFHRMPVSFMQDRVFHALVISAHSSYPRDATPGTPFSFTVQLPIDFDSLNVSEAVMQRSHIKASGSSRRYHVSSDASSATAQTTEDQKKRIGKKLTEGNYVSFERLKAASKENPTDTKSPPAPPPKDTEYHHLWDMMTLSTAAGITELAPSSVTHKEILKAIGADVDHVIKHIAEARQRKIGNAAA